MSNHVGGGSEIMAWQAGCVFLTWSMRPMRSLFFYMGMIFLGAALLSPWVYWLAQWAAKLSPSFTRLGAQPFHRYVHRSMLGLALVGLWPFLRSIRANSWSAVGLTKPAGQWRRLGIGFLLGFASLACVALLAFAGGARAMSGNVSATSLSKEFVSAAFTAGVVACLEELLFRGALFGALRKAHGWVPALLVSSAVYALVHFFQKPPPPADVTWTSGLQVLPLMLRGFVDLEMLIPGFFTLMLAGMILGLGYQQSGNLFFSIGLHAGWIFWLKFYGAVTVPVSGGRTWFWGTGKLIDGWFALAVLLPVLIAVWRFLGKKEEVPIAA